MNKYLWWIRGLDPTHCKNVDFSPPLLVRMLQNACVNAQKTRVCGMIYCVTHHRHGTTVEATSPHKQPNYTHIITTMEGILTIYHRASTGFHNMYIFSSINYLFINVSSEYSAKLYPLCQKNSNGIFVT